MEHYRLINENLIDESVELLNNFSSQLYSLSLKYDLSVKDSKELYDKITKGNEGLVSSFLNNHRDTLGAISELVSDNIVNFKLTLNPHGTDGYFISQQGDVYEVELKTTSGKVAPTRKSQRRSSETDLNVVYRNAFKFHFTDGCAPFEEQFEKELANFRRGQVTIFAGLYEIEGFKKVGDIFFLNSEQSMEVLSWGKDNRCDGKTMQIPPTILMEGGSLESNCHHIFSDVKIGHH